MSDLSTDVASVALRSAILTAAGTSGYGDELAGYGDLAALGAVVVNARSERRGGKLILRGARGPADAGAPS